MADAVHVNAAGGAKIAARLDEQIAELVRTARPVAAADDSVGKEVGSPPEGRVPEGCIAHLSADGKKTVDESGRMMRWIDATGHGADAIAVWPWSRPEFVADAGDGRPALRFDGRQSYLSLPMLADLRTLVVVFRGSHLVLGHPYFNSRPFHPGVARPGKAFSAIRGKGARRRPWLSQRPAGAYRGRSRRCAGLRPPGIQVCSLVMSEPVPFSVLGWGGSWNHDRYMLGDVAEVLIFNRELDDAERQVLEDSLCSRWGISRSP